MVFRALKEKIAGHKILTICVATVLALLPISFIGWLVHYYFIWELGLPQLMSWKIPYWIAEMLTAATYSFMAALGFWLVAQWSEKNKWTAFLVGITAFYQWGCGLFDWLWFLIHGLMGHVAEFPGLHEIWWWNPYYWFLGIEWTTLHHIIYTIILEIIFIGAWVVWNYRVNE